MQAHKYVGALAKSCSSVFGSMTGTNVDRVALQQEKVGVCNFPLSISIDYSLMNATNVGGNFLMGFSDDAMALRVASAILENMGLPVPEEMNDAAADALAEYLNVVIGHTISQWDKMGMPVSFGPPSKLKQATLDTDDCQFESYTITLIVGEHRLEFTTTFSSQMENKMQEQRVLVVDDSQMMRQVVSDTLEKKGFLVRQAKDGMEAVQIFGEFKPHLTLMDLVMPRMGGLDAMMTIRDFAPDARFMVLSSSQRTDEIVSAKTIGVNEYLIKPMKPSELLAAVGKVFDQKL